MIWLLVPIVLVVGAAAAILHDRRCPECGQKFPTSDDMLAHLDRYHP